MRGPRFQFRTTPPSNQEKVDFGSKRNVYRWVADFPCVQFGFAMRQRECLGVCQCQVSLAIGTGLRPATETPSPRYLESAIYWNDMNN